MAAAVAPTPMDASTSGGAQVAPEAKNLKVVLRQPTNAEDESINWDLEFEQGLNVEEKAYGKIGLDDITYLTQVQLSFFLAGQLIYRQYYRNVDSKQFVAQDYNNIEKIVKRLYPIMNVYDPDNPALKHDKEKVKESTLLQRAKDAAKPGMDLCLKVVPTIPGGDEYPAVKMDKLTMKKVVEKMMQKVGIVDPNERVYRRAIHKLATNAVANRETFNNARSLRLYGANPDFQWANIGGKMKGGDKLNSGTWIGCKNLLAKVRALCHIVSQGEDLMPSDAEMVKFKGNAGMKAMKIVEWRKAKLSSAKRQMTSLLGNLKMRGKEDDELFLGGFLDPDITPSGINELAAAVSDHYVKHQIKDGMSVIAPAWVVGIIFNKDKKVPLFITEINAVRAMNRAHEYMQTSIDTQILDFLYMLRLGFDEIGIVNFLLNHQIDNGWITRHADTDFIGMGKSVATLPPKSPTVNCMNWVTRRVAFLPEGLWTSKTDYNIICKTSFETGAVNTFEEDMFIRYAGGIAPTKWEIGLSKLLSEGNNVTVKAEEGVSVRLMPNTQELLISTGGGISYRYVDIDPVDSARRANKKQAVDAGRETLSKRAVSAVTTNLFDDANFNIGAETKAEKAQTVKKTAFKAKTRATSSGFAKGTMKLLGYKISRR